MSELTGTIFDPNTMKILNSMSPPKKSKDPSLSSSPVTHPDDDELTKQRWLKKPLELPNTKLQKTLELAKLMASLRTKEPYPYANPQDDEQKRIAIESKLLYINLNYYNNSSLKVLLKKALQNPRSERMVTLIKHEIAYRKAEENKLDDIIAACRINDHGL